MNLDQYTTYKTYRSQTTKDYDGLEIKNMDMLVKVNYLII